MSKKTEQIQELQYQLVDRFSKMLVKDIFEKSLNQSKLAPPDIMEAIFVGVSFFMGSAHNKEFLSEKDVKVACLNIKNLAMACVAENKKNRTH